MKNKKVFLVIQGHTSKCDQMLEKISGLENVIWSTEKTMPQEDLKKIEAAGVKLALGDPPSFNGYGNVNIQVLSTIRGLELAKSLGATHAIKIRSDLMFSDPERFIKYYPFDNKIHQFAYIEHTDLCINTVKFYPGIPMWLEDKGYADIITDVSDYNYISDFCNLGPIDEILLFCGLPKEEQAILIPAEHKFVLHYLNNKGYKDIKLTYEWLASVFGFFITHCKHTNNPLTSMKHGWSSDGLLESKDIIFKG